MYGAIGNALVEPIYMLGSATCQEEFLKFIRGLAAAKRDPNSKPFLVMDNVSYTFMKLI